MERQITPFAPGKIFPPLPRDATPFTPAAMPAVFGLRSGGAVFLGGLFVALLGAMIIGSAAFLVVNAFGAPDGVGLQCAAAFGLFGGSALSLAWTLQRVRSRFPRTLTDRSVLGCAWFGAPDEVVVTAYLGGGLINLIGLLGMPIAVMTDVDMSSPLTPFAHWHAVPMMVFAFALIAARPVLEELLFRAERLRLADFANHDPRNSVESRTQESLVRIVRVPHDDVGLARRSDIELCLPDAMDRMSSRFEKRLQNLGGFRQTVDHQNALSLLNHDPCLPCRAIVHRAGV